MLSVSVRACTAGRSGQGPARANLEVVVCCRQRSVVISPAARQGAVVRARAEVGLVRHGWLVPCCWSGQSESEQGRSLRAGWAPIQVTLGFTWVSFLLVRPRSRSCTWRTLFGTPCHVTVALHQ